MLFLSIAYAKEPTVSHSYAFSDAFTFFEMKEQVAKDRVWPKWLTQVRSLPLALLLRTPEAGVPISPSLANNFENK